MTNLIRPNRRQVLAATGSIVLSVPAASAAYAERKADEDGFAYEVTRTDAEWREMLTEYEYGILREGKTEKQKSSPLWEESRAGSFYCKGCGLHLYDSKWKRMVEGKGWVFFVHSVPNSIFTGIDWPPEANRDSPLWEDTTTLEVHCRRCGSHIGHIFNVPGEGGGLLHCVNGHSLTFTPAEA